MRQWAIDDCGVVSGHVSEEDVRASLLELADNVAAVAPGCNLSFICVPFYLLRHFLVVQAGENGLDDGRYEDILRDLGVNTPLPVLDAMGIVTTGSLDFDIAALDEALRAIYDPPVSAP